jgi:ribonuclease Z
MHFETTILGCGAGLPTLQRHASSQVVNVRENYFLVDCGESTQLQMRKYGIRYQRIDHIFISHLHGDHYLGLPGLLLSMNMLGRNKPIHVYAHARLKEVIELNCKVSDTRLQFALHFHELKDDGMHLLFENKAVEVYSFPMKHRVPCCGFLFKEKQRLRHINKVAAEKHSVPALWMTRLKEGQDFITEDGTVIKNEVLTTSADKSYSYACCSDTRYHEPLIEFIQGVDLLYHEATFTQDKADRATETMHTTAQDAARLAKKAGVGKLIITHFSARYRNEDELLKEARQVFENTVAARDGLVVRLY